MPTSLSEDEDMTPYEKYMIDTYGDEQRKLNNDVDLIFETEDYPDELYSEVWIICIFLRRIVQRATYLGCDQFEFEYSYMDIQELQIIRILWRSDVIRMNRVQ